MITQAYRRQYTARDLQLARIQGVAGCSLAIAGLIVLIRVIGVWL